MNRVSCIVYRASYVVFGVSLNFDRVSCIVYHILCIVQLFKINVIFVHEIGLSTFTEKNREIG